MDMREFLEKDMVGFLDARLSVDYLKDQSTQARLEEATTLFGKDYEKLLLEALGRHDLATAKGVLHDVRNEFMTHPIGSPERRQLQALLHELYAKFKQHLQDQTCGLR
jgi:hypothetical protein